MSYDKIRAFNVLFRRNQEQNKDVITIVTGMRGDGKSNLAMVLALVYLQEFGLKCRCGHEWVYDQKVVTADKEGNSVVTGKVWQPCPLCGSQEVQKVTRLNFRRYMGYDDDEIKDRIHNRSMLPDWSPLLGDEAVRWAYSQDFAKSDNKDMKKLFTQDRPRRLIKYVNMPNFNRLDSNYREMANYHIWVMQRTDRNAIAVLFVQDKGNKADPWHLKELDKIVPPYNENTPMERVVEICEKIISKHPCAFDWFRIPPIPEEVYEDYEQYRNFKVFEKKDVDPDIDEREIAKVFIYNLYTQWQIFEGEVKRGKFNRPTVRLMEKYLFENPQTHKPLISYVTARNWIKKVERQAKA